jgi:hypothetical protein
MRTDHLSGGRRPTTVQGNGQEGSTTGLEASIHLISHRALLRRQSSEFRTTMPLLAKNRSSATSDSRRSNAIRAVVGRGCQKPTIQAINDQFAGRFAAEKGRSAAEKPTSTASGLIVAPTRLVTAHFRFTATAARRVIVIRGGDDGLIELCLSEHHLILQPSPAGTHIIRHSPTNT